MMATPDAQSSSLPTGGRGRLWVSARPYSILAAAVLTCALIGCGRTQAPPELNRWPIAVSPDLLGLSTDIAWLSPDHRTQVRTLALPSPADAGGQVTAICRSPALEYEVHVDTDIRSGFLAFHEGGAASLSVDPDDAAPTQLTVEGNLRDVRDAECVCPTATDSGDVVVLVTGGEVPSRKPDGQAEPPPWVTSAEVQLAWLRGNTLVVGDPEPLAGTNPWAVRSGRFAGEDGNLLICVYTKSPFDEVIRRRPWIYRVAEGDDGEPRLDPRWRGTSFSRPFRDATFADLTGRGEGEIAALEVAQDGGRVLTGYTFEGFGLEGLASSLKLPDVGDRLKAADWSADGRDELVLRGTDGSFHFYQLDAGAQKLREVRTIDGPRAVLGWIVTSASHSEPGRLLCVLPTGETWQADSRATD